MLCDRCNINQASIHLENNINGTVKKVDLCPQCAQLLGFKANSSLLEQIFGQVPLAAAGLDQSLFGLPQAMRIDQAGTDICPSCSTNFHEFQKSALFGCPDCYKSFQSRLAPIFKRVQAGQTHVGRKLATVGQKPEVSDTNKEMSLSQAELAEIEAQLSPQDNAGTGNESSIEKTTLESLRAEQTAAVKEEDYERAAEIRDQIKLLEAAERKRKTTKHVQDGKTSPTLTQDIKEEWEEE